VVPAGEPLEDHGLSAAVGRRHLQPVDDTRSALMEALDGLYPGGSEQLSDPGEALGTRLGGIVIDGCRIHHRGSSLRLPGPDTCQVAQVVLSGGIPDVARLWARRQMILTAWASVGAACHGAADRLPIPSAASRRLHRGNAGRSRSTEGAVYPELRRKNSRCWSVTTFAAVLADLQARLERLDPDPPLGRPMWLAWDHPEKRVWPEEGVEYPAGERVEPPDWLTDIARRVRGRMRGVDLPEIVGHADWETQHLRWRHGQLLVVHDWDSLSLRSEAALAGAAAATFPSDPQPALAPLVASDRFLLSYPEPAGSAVLE